jgi:hypothetical protein
MALIMENHKSCLHDAIEICRMANVTNRVDVWQKYEWHKKPDHLKVAG